MKEFVAVWCFLCVFRASAEVGRGGGGNVRHSNSYKSLQINRNGEWRREPVHIFKCFYVCYECNVEYRYISTRHSLRPACNYAENEDRQRQRCAQGHVVAAQAAQAMDKTRFVVFQFSGRKFPESSRNWISRNSLKF